MRFTFTEEQEALRQGFRQVMEAECTPADVRHAVGPPEGPPPGPSAERWRVLAGLGAQGLLAPEPEGLGLSEVELTCVLEEAGRAALPEPLAETAAVTVPVLAEAARREDSPGAATARSWMASLAAGRTAAAIGGLRVGAHGVGSDSVRQPDGRVLTPRVAAAGWPEVGVLLLGAPGGSAGSAAAGTELHLVPADAVERRPVTSLDPTRQLADVLWAPAEQSRLDAGHPGDPACSLAGLVADRAALAAAGQLLGLAESLVAMAAAYARERHQFGRPIGSFQAVKHHLADARVRWEFTRPVVYRAAWSMARPSTTPAERVHDVAAAKAMATDTAELAARSALQVHGAIGYTWECDLHLWMKRVWALAAAWGDASAHRARVLGTLLRRQQDPRTREQ